MPILDPYCQLILSYNINVQYLNTLNLTLDACCTSRTRHDCLIDRDGWTDGHMGGYADRRVDGWTDGHMGGYADRRVIGWTVR